MRKYGISTFYLSRFPLLLTLFPLLEKAESRKLNIPEFLSFPPTLLLRGYKPQNFRLRRANTVIVKGQTALLEGKTLNSFDRGFLKVNLRGWSTAFSNFFNLLNLGPTIMAPT